MDAQRPAETTVSACRVRLRAAAVLLIAVLCGCAAHRGQSLSDLPFRHTVRAERIVVHSDMPVTADSQFVTELAQLRLDILSTLALPEPRRPVIVYLFADEARYTAYMERHFPKLPSRRAFFVGSPTELAVYAFHGEHLRTDLRHEYTHGVLHACLRNVPLWLDEGLAEYFEPPREKGRINDEHLERLTIAIEGGWKPNLERLEQLADVAEMQAMDYHEAWAWVYTWLQSPNEDERQKLVGYIHQLRESQPPGRLSQLLGLSNTEAGGRVLAELASLNGNRGPAAFPDPIGRASFAESVDP